MSLNSSLFFRCFFLIVFTFYSQVSSQKKITPTWITIDEGLSQGFIAALHQDDNGFLWIGTKAGLDRFDGREFKHFGNNPIDDTSLRNPQIRSIKGNRDFILVGTEEDLYLYAIKHNKFYALQLGFGIADIYKESELSYWIANINGGFYKLDLKNDIFQIPDKETTDISSFFSLTQLENININPYFKFRKFEDKLVFFLQNGRFKELTLFNPKTKQLEKLIIPDLEKIPSQMRIGYTVFQDTILVYSDDANYIYKKGIWKKLPTNFKINTAINLPQKKMVVMGTPNKYLFYNYDVLNNTFFEKDASFIIESPKTVFYNILEDDSGNIWIGTSGYGLIKISERQLKIQHYCEGKSIYAKPFVSKKGTIFINNQTTQENLILKGHPDETPHIKDFINAHFQVEIYQHPINNKLWGISKLPNGFTIHQQTDKGFQPFKKLEIPDSYHLIIADINPFTNEMVIFTGGDIVFVNLDNKKMTRHNLMGHLDVISMSINSPNEMWIATLKGVFWITRNGDNISHLLFNSENSNLLNNKVACVHVDDENSNIVWVGTKGAGLHKFNKLDKTFEPVGINQNFPDKTVYGILEDDNHKLWLSTNKGLLVYNKKTHELKNFLKNDGLQGNEFNTYAFNKGLDGKMYFGGTNGLNFFHPKDIAQNTHKAKAFITEIKVNNEEIISDIGTEFIDQIHLDYSQNNLNFKFATTEHTAPFKNTFSYYLDGAEPNWIHATSDNKANYLNLLPGSYTFKLKAANSDNLWNSDFTSLKITITPPWYQTNWAYALYFVLISLLLFGFIKVREDRIHNLKEQEKAQLQNQLLENKIASKQKDLADLATTISENTKWRNYLLESLKKIKESRGKTKEKYFNELINEIKIKTSTEKNRVEYQNKIDTLNNEFYTNLLNEYPNLSKSDLKLCSLLKLELTSKEIAQILNIELKSVYINRSRLRKKMELPKDVDLISTLKKV